MLAALALLALVVGIPAALWLLAGTDPFPTSLPDKETLTGQLTFKTLLNVLLFVVWLAWLFFVVCVVVEIAAARRGGLAQPVPLGGPLQKLARALVGARAAGRGDLRRRCLGCWHPPSNAGAEVRLSVRRRQQRRGRRRRCRAAAGRASRAAHEITEQEHLVGHKVYTVAAPKDGYHDNLWDIAERHLGDGRRYKEIYELNKGLKQPDGRKLQLARLIQPGWNLVDARGRRRRTADARSAAGSHATRGSDTRSAPRPVSTPGPTWPPSRVSASCRVACSAPACSPRPRWPRSPSSAAVASVPGPSPRTSRSSCVARPPRPGRSSSTARCAT